VWLLSVLKFVGAPGSIAFFVVFALAGALLLLRARWRRAGRAWLLILAAIYLILGLPVVANRMLAALDAWHTSDATVARGIDALVVFDGDNRRGRVREARAVYAVSTPAEVWVIGNPWMLDPLLQSGIPYNSIKHDGAATTTREQMTRLQTFLSSHPRTAVIASRLQMPRIAALAGAMNLRVLFVASPIDDEPPTTGVRRFVPAYIALRTSRDAFYELVALRYYAWKGWIAPPSDRS
jgi:uncharacterized SAM-binding protein YcdF (DUF218 family)